MQEYVSVPRSDNMGLMLFTLGSIVPGYEWSRRSRFKKPFGGRREEGGGRREEEGGRREEEGGGGRRKEEGGRRRREEDSSR